MIHYCLLCETTIEEQPDPDSWTPVVLLEPVDLRTTFLDGLLDSTTFPAGLWWLCTPCAAWRPEARTAPPPNSFGALLADLATLIHTPELKRQFHREVLGGYRHLARQLRTLTTD